MYQARQESMDERGRSCHEEVFFRELVLLMVLLLWPKNFSQAHGSMPSSTQSYESQRITSSSKSRYIAKVEESTYFTLTGDMQMTQCKFARTLSTKQRARFSGVSTKSGLVLIAKGRISAAIMCNSSWNVTHVCCAAILNDGNTTVGGSVEASYISV